MFGGVFLYYFWVRFVSTTGTVSKWWLYHWLPGERMANTDFNAEIEDISKRGNCLSLIQKSLMGVKYKEEEEEEQVDQFAICTSPIIHLVCPPPPPPNLFAQSLSWVSLGTAVILRRNEKQRLSNFFGEWGGGAKGREQGALWEMRKWLIASLPSLALKQNINATSMITYCWPLYIS